MRFINNVKKFFKGYTDFAEYHPYIDFALSSVLVTFILEALSRKSIVSAAAFVGRSPMTFLCNVFIVFLTLCITMLFGRFRKFAQAMVSTIWLILGVVNAIVTHYRMTPFSAEDFALISSLLQIFDNYFSVINVIEIAAGVAAVVLLIHLLWKRLPRTRKHYNWAGVGMKTGAAFLGLYAVLNMGMQTSAISTDFMNLADAYEQYGFAYCFSTSVVDVGISKPDNYSEQTVAQVADQIRENKGNQDLSFTDEEGTDVKPNIIMIQLESFFDPTYLKNYSYSEDPIPFFRSIKESDQFASGFLTVPVVGAGTANTEFEVLTGMSTDYFGAGEYPYNTVLQEKTVESLPQILKNNNYRSTVIHNNTGSFYNRNIVFSQMGFDQFIPEEYMYDLTTTPNNWNKDDVLPGIIMDSLNESEGRDFIYTITVQSHGRYATEQVIDNPLITVTNKTDESVHNYALEYYVNEIHEVDQMIENLCTQLENSEEPTVLIMFGDHLPALGFGKDDLSSPSLYQTEYVVWNNFGLKMNDRDMQAESLGSAVLETFGLDEGIIPSFHEAYDGTEGYSDALELLEYDMLYGEGYIFRQMEDDYGYSLDPAEAESEDGIVSPYRASDLKIAYKPITVTSAEVKDGVLYVYGENFNPYSKIVINGKYKDTTYVDRNTLTLSGSVPGSIDELYVGQFDANHNQLGDGTNTLTDVLTEDETETQ